MLECINRSSFHIYEMTVSALANTKQTTISKNGKTPGRTDEEQPNPGIVYSLIQKPMKGNGRILTGAPTKGPKSPAEKLRT